MGLLQNGALELKEVTGLLIQEKDRLFQRYFVKQQLLVNRRVGILVRDRFAIELDR